MYPSTRKDLPPNVVVTKVNVEVKNWVAGVGKIIKGTDRDYVPSGREFEEVEEDEEDEEMGAIEEVVAVAKEVVPGWEGWPSSEEVENTWYDLREAVKDEAKEGDWVAVKVCNPDFHCFLVVRALLILSDIRFSSWTQFPFLPLSPSNSVPSSPPPLFASNYILLVFHTKKNITRKKKAPANPGTTTTKTRCETRKTLRWRFTDRDLGRTPKSQRRTTRSLREIGPT